MDAKKVIEVVDRYDNTLLVMGATEPRRGPVDQLFPFSQSPVLSRNTIKAHLRWMCDRTKEFAADNPPRLEKAFRWLGFIQCGMWLLGVHTVDELANHSRPDDKEACSLCQGNRVVDGSQGTTPCPNCITGEGRV